MASYKEMQPDVFMTQWIILDPLPVFDTPQVQPGMQEQQQVFESDSVSFSDIIKSIPAKVYTRNNQNYNWQFYDSKNDIIDLIRIFGQKEYVISYAWAEINSNEDKEILFALGSDDGVKVWLNGNLIHENWVGRPVIRDNDICPMQLQKGRNQILIKVQNMQGGWGFSCRAISKAQISENLVFAAWDGDLDRVKTLLQQNIDINTKNTQGITALQCARIKNQDEIARFLIESGADQSIEMPAKSRFVDMVFNREIKPGSPGAAMAVASNGKILYEKGYGLAQLEYDIRITPQTIFHVASVSKQFTAFAIALLADQGKLSLDDDIHKYLPEVPDFGTRITIRQLICHTSGIRDQWEFLAMSGWRLDDVITKDQILRMVSHQKELNFIPGSEMLYCNTGYTLLAEIVARVSGMSFPEFTQKNIFTPLGMNNSHFHDDHEMIVKNRAYSYTPGDKSAFKKSVLSYANAGATSLFTTVEDMIAWNNNFDDGRVGGMKVIGQMYERGILNNGDTLGYAFGLGIDNYKGIKTIGHSGGDAGFRSYTVRFPDNKLSIVVLSNFGEFNPVGKAYDVAEIYLAGEFPDLPEQEKKSMSPAERTEIKVNPDIYDDYSGRYQMTPGFIISITREDERLMAQATGQGKFQIFPESETKFFYKVVDAQISFQKDNDGSVSQLTLHQNGRDMPAKRVIENPYNPTQINQYCGDYYSDELGTFYTLYVKNGKLAASHRRHGEIELTPLTRDSFNGNQWWFQNIKITRDGNDTITGFKLTGFRVRNLNFVKQ